MNRGIRKPLQGEQIFSLLGLIKEAGLKTYGTFMFGAPRSSMEEDLKSIELIQELIRSGLMDNLQVSVCTPLPGTPFYEWARERGYIAEDDFSQFDGGSRAVVNYPHYSSQEILKIKDQAVRVRNHLLFIRRVKQGQGWRWFKKVLSKYGAWRSLCKLLRRVSSEIAYQAGWGKR